MRSEKKILLAFLLNFIFSILECIGGIMTGSVAIVSDAVHDFGDSLSIGTSFLLEKISRKKPDEKYTFGYYRYSVLGSVLQSVILLSGSLLVIYRSVERFFHPAPINYDGMILIGVVGFIVNFAAAYFTKGEGSLNQKAINLHMLEDVLGWAIVLIGACIMRFTNWCFLDPILSIGLAIFILLHVLKSLQSVLNIFLEKTPRGIYLGNIKERLLSLDGVLDVHHLHVWSMDGYKNAATMHIVTDGDIPAIKKKVKEELKTFDISHVTVEVETEGEICDDIHCEASHSHTGCHHHHHH